MREDLEATLGRGDGGRGQLERWLRDLDLPPGSGDEEPYVWVLRGLSALDDYAPAERILAAWAADLLRQHPEPGVPAEDRDQYLYNLLRLAARLSSPDELWEPLLELYECRSIDGSYLGVEHRDGLLEALVQNQADTRLREVWLRMARGEPDEYLRGTSEDGLWALTRGPDPERGRGFPDIEGVGSALDHHVETLEKESTRRSFIYKKCMTLLSAYPNRRREIEERLILRAHSSAWPGWAVASLPNLFLSKPDNARSVYVWSTYRPILPSANAGKGNDYALAGVTRVKQPPRMP